MNFYKLLSELDQKWIEWRQYNIIIIEIMSNYLLITRI